MNNFLILGLPRSRTAWLANFMTYDGHYCSHEGLNGCRNMKEYMDKFLPGTGDSNTGLAMFDFIHMFDKYTRIVVIDRDIKRAVSYTKEHYNTDISTEMAHLKGKLDQIQGLHIPYHAIDRSLQQIWEYISNKPYDIKRGDLLKSINIKVKEPYDMDIAAYKSLMESIK